MVRNALPNSRHFEASAEYLRCCGARATGPSSACSSMRKRSCSPSRAAPRSTRSRSIVREMPAGRFRLTASEFRNSNPAEDHRRTIARIAAVRAALRATRRRPEAPRIHRPGSTRKDAEVPLGGATAPVEPDGSGVGASRTSKGPAVAVPRAAPLPSPLPPPGEGIKAARSAESQVPSPPAGERARERGGSWDHYGRSGPASPNLTDNPRTMSDQYVYYFGDGQADGNAKMKDVLGGKGAGLAEMTNIGVPVPPGFTISTGVCTYFYEHDKTYPPELQASRSRENLATRRGIGRTGKFGDAQQAAARLRALRRARVDAGHDGHDPQPRAERRDRAGARQVVRRRSASRSTPIAASSRCTPTSCWRSTASTSSTSCTRMRERVRRDRTTPRFRPRRCASWSAIYKRHRAREARRRVPAGRARAALGRDRRRVQLLEQPARHHLPQAQPDPRRLGHRRQRAVDGLRQHGRRLAPPASRSRATPPPASASSSASTCRTRRARTSSPASARRCRSRRRRSCDGRAELSLEEAFPDVYEQLVDVYKKLESHYRDMQDIEFTIQRGKLYLLQTRTGKRTGFAAVKIAVRHGRRRR